MSTEDATATAMEETTIMQLPAGPLAYMLCRLKALDVNKAGHLLTYVGSVRWLKAP